MPQRVYSLFQQSVEAKMQVGEELAPLINQAGDILVESLIHEGKILICGNGVSAALAQIFSSSLIDRFEKERPSLPAIWLGSNIATYTAITADYNQSEVYAKPVRALGQEGDILVVISSSGNSANLVQAISAAHDRGMNVIALTGRDGGDISSLLDVNDIELRADLNSRGRIHEVHMLTIFCLCDLIDHRLFGLE
ncbi:D-sedoheptulose-7-phosphate isomerase [Saccharophagus degradans]|uniref:Phosphoheptose isomerase n=2 Tax=Saccharophagus degradans TaxID=86304 RepID=Q21FX5_SACD2|nr:SIS domain-containing protein [Saccharophagus degradans]ABD82404.1 phosphoheptose isomerase [Saccharophagus degradans 2-40]MBU2985403.1 SIS domain-containing protein [Saccharophagus degradans]MDO6421483.1 SIS domain-containing protein [Saccharophagus degradans]MDO6608703.1 SIS domain-containing protein [Saccharophagus degradans]WGO99399.1 SIS domain-containing protein [Saccharophagus degradans]